MNYQETIDYLYSRLPVFQNIGARAYKPGLNTTQELCKLLDNPQDRYQTIHVGGTNGKGSTSHMLAAILQKSGYRVGLYTSPHLKSFTERIKVNGQEVEQSFIVEFANGNLSNIDKLRPSFFEVTVAMAFSYFAKEKVDIAVIEVGMGGRLDSTNIITPVLSVITNVSFDHTQFLGDTLVKIAGEKAGIIKANIPVVVSEHQDEIASIFENIAHDQKAPLYFASQTVTTEAVDAGDGKLCVHVKDVGDPGFSYESLRLDLAGSYQFNNIKGVLKSVEVLKSKGFSIPDSAIYQALAKVVDLTGLKGRWQKLRINPVVYCDTAHNAAGLSQTLSQFNSLSTGKQRFVIGFVGDKDIRTMLSLFPVGAHFYFTQPSNTRALRAEDLQNLAAEFNLYGNIYSDVNLALDSAISDSNSNDCIYVGGSTFVVADIEGL
jgi:dihydrofolate synthase/folylpolyglutamate synthase